MSVENKSLYTRTTIIRKLFVVIHKGAETKIRIPKIVYKALAQHFDQVIQDEVKKILDRIPKKQRGDSKGELKRLTLKIEDLNGVPEELEEEEESEEEEEEEVEETDVEEDDVEEEGEEIKTE